MNRHDSATEIGRRMFLAGCAGSAFSLSSARPAGAEQAAPLAGVPSVSDFSNVNPELRPTLERFLSLAKDRALAKGSAAGRGQPLADVPWEERRIAGAAGSPDVTIYVINARRGTARPAILHIHGGGFVAGNARDGVVALQKLAKALDCVIVTVDYRLAPATRWEGSTEDNYAGLKWLYANAAEIGGDRARIAVMGESAGGGHAALLAIRARDRAEVPLVFQCLIYPMLDDRTVTSRRIPQFRRIVWTPQQNHDGWRAFLGQEPGGPDVPSAAVPARTANLAGLPPAWIGVGSIDLFVDEDIEYARRLIDSGVPTTLEVVPGAFHGFDALPDALGTPASISNQFNAAKLNALRRAFGMPAVV